MIRAALPLSALFLASSAVASVPPPAPKHWTRIAWECQGREQSFIEIEQVAEGTPGYRTRVVALKIAGPMLDPQTVSGLDTLVARRNHLRPVAGYCEEKGELFGIEEMVNEPGTTFRWRAFHVAYQTT